MPIKHIIVALSLTAALVACNLAQSPSIDDAQAGAQDTLALPGHVVDEIDSRIWDIYQARNGDYWFGSNGGGVYRYDGELLTCFNKADGLSGDQVRDIREDGKGNVFVAANSGVDKFDGERFTRIAFVDVPYTGDEWVLDPDDVWIVFAPGSHGPCRYDGEKLYRLELSKSPAEDAFRAKHPDSSFSPTGVYSAYKDRKGHLWFGTANAGLCRFDGKTLSWMFEERLTTTPSGGAFGIRSIFEDRAGDFWICNTRQRFEIAPEVIVEDGYSLIKYERKVGLPDAQSDADDNFDYYHSMIEDGAGALWMACGGNGVWKYADGKVTRYKIGDEAYAITIYSDRAGRLWVGTLEDGVWFLGATGFERFRARK